MSEGSKTVLKDAPTNKALQFAKNLNERSTVTVTPKHIYKEMKTPKAKQASFVITAMTQTDKRRYNSILQSGSADLLRKMSEKDMKFEEVLKFDKKGNATPKIKGMAKLLDGHKENPESVERIAAAQLNIINTYCTTFIIDGGEADFALISDNFLRNTKFFDYLFGEIDKLSENTGFETQAL